MQRIAKRYAKAFFSSTESDPARARANLKAMQPLKELFADADAAKVLSSPVMPAELKANLLNYALDTGNAPEEVRRFVLSLGSQGRTAAIPDIVDAYAAMIDGSEGLVRADVTSAVPLDDATRDEIRRSLEAVSKKRVELVPEVDPALMGGFKVRMGNYLVDLSLKTRLDSLSAGAVADRIG
jgi:F-type H+-transporting ATPase subunit delta